jgi:hypothetical protein
VVVSACTVVLWQVVLGHVAFEGEGPIFTTPRAHINQPIKTKFGTFDKLVHNTNLANSGYDRMKGKIVGIVKR